MAADSRNFLKNLFIFYSRQVFSIADKDVVSPAYEHFRENLQDLCSVDEGPVRFLCSQVDLSFPQYFHYMRTKELVSVFYQYV